MVVVVSVGALIQKLIQLEALTTAHATAINVVLVPAFMWLYLNFALIYRIFPQNTKTFRKTGLGHNSFHYILVEA